MVIAEKKSNFNLTLFAVLTVMYTVAYNSYFRSISILWYGISVFTIFVLGLTVLGKRNVKLNFFIYWAVIFYVFTVASSLWSLNPSKSISPILTLSLIFVVGILMSLLFNSREDLKSLLFINFIALFLCAIYILIAVDPELIGETRIGLGTVGDMWNANDIGLKMCVGLGIALYFLYESDKVYKRLIYLAACIIFIAIALLTGSRTALFMVYGIVFLIIFIRSKGVNRVYAILFLIVFSIGLFVLIMNYEPLYNVIGERVEDMINGLFGQGTDDGSFNYRVRFIEYGLHWFGERPLFGYGAGNFSELSAAQFGEKFDTYSHNNFIEMLVNGGLVGFIIYYAVYFYVLFKLLRYVFIEKDLIAIILFTLNLVSLVLQVAMVSYTSTLFTTLILFTVIYIISKERGKDIERQG